MNMRKDGSYKDIKCSECKKGVVESHSILSMHLDFCFGREKLYVFCGNKCRKNFYKRKDQNESKEFQERK